MSTRYRAQAALPTCPEHPDQDLDTYCVKCNKRVCESCRPDHKDHEWQRMKWLVRHVRQNAVSRCQDISQILSNIKSITTKGTARSKTTSSRQKQVEKIRRVQNGLKSMVDDIAEMMISMVNDDDGDDTINMPAEIRKWELMLDFFQNQLDEADDSVIMEVEEEFHIKREKISSLQTPGPEVKFVEGNASRDVLQHMFGRVVKGDMSNHGDKSEVNVREISHFTHVDDSAFIKSISPISNDKALISRKSIAQIDKVDHTGTVIHERKLPTASDDFIIEDKNNIVYTVFGHKMIRRVSSSGTVSDVCSTAPLLPVGICTSRDGGYLVCLCDCYTPAITPDSRGEVHHIDSSGVVLRKYNHTEDQKNKLFINPTRISQNINMDLCVVDRIDKEFTSRLVILTVTSKIKSIYTGQPSLKKKFSSEDVCTENHGRIIVTDLHNHAVHLLDEDGKFLQYILTEQSPLWDPRSLGLHGDTLWVGCGEGVVRVYKYIDGQC